MNIVKKRQHFCLALQAIKAFCLLPTNFSIHSGPLRHPIVLTRLYSSPHHRYIVGEVFLLAAFLLGS